MAEESRTSKTKSLPFNPLVIILVAAAFIIGVLWTRTQNLQEQLGKTTGESGAVAGQQVGQPTQPVNPPPPDTGQQFGSADQVAPVTDADWVRDSRDARIFLIEYSDIDCPFCKRFHPTAQQVVDAYPDQVAWVYRHFPLAQLHPDAPKKAEAVECAADQQGEEGFWKFLDKLIEATGTLDDVPQLAQSVGLNGSQIKTCLDSGKYTSKVDSHQQSGIKAGVTGTPGNILLDTQTGKTQLIPGAVPFEQLKSSIDQMLQE